MPPKTKKTKRTGELTGGVQSMIKRRSRRVRRAPDRLEGTPTKEKTTARVDIESQTDSDTESEELQPARGPPSKPEDIRPPPALAPHLYKFVNAPPEFLAKINSHQKKKSPEQLPKSPSTDTHTTNQSQQPPPTAPSTKTKPTNESQQPPKALPTKTKPTKNSQPTKQSKPTNQSQPTKKSQPTNQSEPSLVSQEPSATPTNHTQPSPQGPTPPALISRPRSIGSQQHDPQVQHTRSAQPSENDQPTESVNGPEEEENEDVGDDFEIPIPEPGQARSIRCKKRTHDGDDAPKTRGIGNGTNAAIERERLGHPIKVVRGGIHNRPANRYYGSLISHEIGSYVRDKLPMSVGSFLELEQETMAGLFDHLSGNFEIDKDDSWFFEYVMDSACARFRDWKSDCRKHYKQYGTELPLEFLDRIHEWRWLIKHFRSSKQKVKSEQMIVARKQKINHHSGKLAFCHRADIHLAKGHIAPLVAAYDEAYSKEPEGALKVKEMQDKIAEFISQKNGDTDDPGSTEDPLPISAQLEIIGDVVSKKRKGTHVSGVGGSLKRPPLPRGRRNNTAELTEALRVQQEKNEIFEARIKHLEELLIKSALGGSAAGGSGTGGSDTFDTSDNNDSDRASLS